MMAITAPAPHQQGRALMMVGVPSGSGFFPLKTLAVGAALIAFTSTASHAAAVSSVRMDVGSSGVAFALREQDTDPSVADSLAEIKRRSGLTWGQLATLFEVSRRTVHSWANGAVVRTEHAGRVSSLMERVRTFGDLPAFKVREQLLGHAIVAPSVEARARREPPILVGDTTPSAYQLGIRPRTTRIKRG